jgi:hypothetical protein
MPGSLPPGGGGGGGGGTPGNRPPGGGGGGGGGGVTPPNLGGGGNPPDDNTAGGADSLASLFQNGSFCCAVGDPTLRSFAGPSPFLMSSKRSSMQNGFGESSP